jgi:hypothetical protein
MDGEQNVIGPTKVSEADCCFVNSTGYDPSERVVEE